MINFKAGLINKYFFKSLIKTTDFLIRKRKGEKLN